MNARPSKSPLAALGSLKKIATMAAAITAISLSTGAVAPQPASAASSLSGCFNYRGVAYRNVSTQLEYMTTSGSWVALNSSYHVTDSRGCYSYGLYGSWTQMNIRVVAAATVPGWRGLFWGYSPYYAQGDGSTYYLGNGSLSFLSLTGLPAAPRSWASTDSWLDSMAGSNSGCESSSAMMVACYMDQHGMVGNTVVQYRDFDGDGYRDAIDWYPNDSSHH